MPYRTPIGSESNTCSETVHMLRRPVGGEGHNLMTGNRMVTVWLIRLPVLPTAPSFGIAPPTQQRPGG